MEGHLEVWAVAGRTLLVFPSTRCTVGSSRESDLVIADASVSRVHALFEWLGGAWFVEDLGSRNGTFLNGQRLGGRRQVRPGSEVRLGLARLVLRGVGSGGGVSTAMVEAPPVLTRREREGRVALWQRLLRGETFTQRAAIREVAAVLVVSDAAVKQHLGNLFAKFGIMDGDRRRVRLANAALSTGAVSLADLRTEP